MTAPEVVEMVMPVYPEEARKNGIKGTVTCRATNGSGAREQASRAPRPFC